MIDIQHWLKQFTDELEKTFRERIWFVGLQGSYGRAQILMNAEKIRNGISVDFEEMSQPLFEWAKSLLFLNGKEKAKYGNSH